MDQAVLFDNVWVGSDPEAALTYANITFVVKQEKELEEEEEDRKRKDSEKKPKDVKKGGSLGPVMERITEAVTKLEEMLTPVERYLQKIGMEPYLDKMIDLGIHYPMIIVVMVPIVLTLIFLAMLGAGKKKPSSAADPSTVTGATGVESRAATEETDGADKKKTDGVTDDDADADEAEVENVEPAGEDEPEEGDEGLRRRAGAGDEADS